MLGIKVHKWIKPGRKNGVFLLHYFIICIGIIYRYTFGAEPRDCSPALFSSRQSSRRSIYSFKNYITGVYFMYILDARDANKERNTAVEHRNEDSVSDPIKFPVLFYHQIVSSESSIMHTLLITETIHTSCRQKSSYRFISLSNSNQYFTSNHFSILCWKFLWHEQIYLIKKISISYPPKSNYKNSKFQYFTLLLEFSKYIEILSIFLELMTVFQSCSYRDLKDCSPI